MRTNTVLVDPSYLARWAPPHSSEPASWLHQKAEVPSVQRAPVWLFVSGGERLICTPPAQVTIRQEDSTYLVECEGLHVFAAGDTAQAAIDSFHEQVVHFFHEYRDLNDDDVIGLGAKLRALYAQHFQHAPAR